jgi:hypothetical protein
MKLSYGLILLAVIVVAGFAIQSYYLDSRINALQNQLEKTKIIVLSYSWAVDTSQQSQGFYRLLVNCTLFNASPNNASQIEGYVYAEYSNAYVQSYNAILVDQLLPWQTKQPLIYPITYNATLGIPQRVWIEVTSFF